jgi:FKBP-type peptidyl-prolyl cis-trans isomerase
VKAADEKKAREEAAIIARKWPGAKPSPRGALVLVTREGQGEPAAAGQTLTARYTAHGILDGRPVASAADEGRPVPGTAAQTFTYVVGTSRINPGLDEALAAMRAGERRTVIATGQAGYGRSGYTSPQKPGEKRFVIPPNTTLVYEIEVLDIRR